MQSADDGALHRVGRNATAIKDIASLSRLQGDITANSSRSVLFLLPDDNILLDSCQQASFVTPLAYESSSPDRLDVLERHTYIKRLGVAVTSVPISQEYLRRSRCQHGYLLFVSRLVHKHHFFSNCSSKQVLSKRTPTKFFGNASDDKQMQQLWGCNLQRSKLMSSL